MLYATMENGDWMIQTFVLHILHVYSVECLVSVYISIVN